MVAALVVLAIAVAGSGPAAAAGKGADHQKIPPGVIARVEALQRVMGYLRIDPTSGPVDTTITLTGHCGFPAQTLTWALAVETEPGLFFAVYFGGVTQPIAASSTGAFSVQLTVPPTSPITGYDITPGPHVVHATCDLTLPTRRDLTPQPFVVTG